MELISERLYLRNFRTEDSRDLYEYLSNEAVVKYEPYGVYSMEAAAEEAKARSGDESFTAVCLKETEKLIGNVYHSKAEPELTNTYEIGYVFNEKYQGIGYATEAVTALIDYLFKEKEAHRIIAHCNPRNVPSWRLLERIGLRREAHQIKNMYFGTTSEGVPEWFDSYQYAILSDEYIKGYMVNDESIIKVREHLEWARLWWEDANDVAKPRVLLVGDSITAGYRPFVQEILGERICVDQLASSRSITDPSFIKELRYMVSLYKYKVIHLNNGLHGRHLDIDEYRKGLADSINAIDELQPMANVILASSTPVSLRGSVEEINRQRDEVIVKRNKIVSGMAEDYNLEMNDLYSLVLGKPNLKSKDGTHFTEEGYRILAEKVAYSIRDKLTLG